MKAILCESCGLRVRFFSFRELTPSSPIPYRGEAGIVWSYWAAGGDASMGIFTIDCSEARQVMNSFTTGGTEATLMFYFEARRTIDVPTLQLTGPSEEAQSWLCFVQTVQPQQSP